MNTKVTIVSDTHVATSSIDTSAEIIKKGEIVNAMIAFDGYISVPLRNPRYGWVSTHRMSEETRKNKQFFRVDWGTPFYSDSSQSSTKISGVTYDITGFDLEVVWRNDEWFKLKIDHGWIPAENVWPVIEKIL